MRFNGLAIDERLGFDLETLCRRSYGAVSSILLQHSLTGSIVFSDEVEIFIFPFGSRPKLTPKRPSPIHRNKGINPAALQQDTEHPLASYYLLLITMRQVDRESNAVQVMLARQVNGSVEALFLSIFADWLRAI